MHVPDAFPITTDELTVKIGGDTILDGINLMIEPGEFVAIMGPNGSGKTTLFNAILGETYRGAKVTGNVYYGDVPVFGDDNAAAGGLRRAIGIVRNTEDNLRAKSTVAAEIGHPYALKGQPVARGDIEEAGETLGVATLLDRQVGTLSAGQKKRVNIARTLVGRPGIVFLDEPMAPLHPEAKDELNDYLAGIAMAGQTVVMITHEDRQVDRAIHLNDGKLVGNRTEA